MRQALRVGPRHLAYLETGAGHGRTLVLLHAFPLNATMWQPQFSAPPPGWRVIAPDFAGLGSTDDHARAAVALDDYAHDVVTLLDRLGIGRAVVAGVSLGGYVALALARLVPARLAGLVLVDTKAPADSPEAREGRARMLDVLDDRGTGGVADDMLPRLLGETSRREQPALVEHLRSTILTNDPEGVRRAILRLRDRPDATPGLASIAVPTLVVVGDEDVVTPPEEAVCLAEGIPGARLERIASAGHLSSLEQPAAFNRVLADFLSRL
jgi:pimeloyl-ACP methyl ester carboxylesterase